ncbi:MAG: hypothetical protein ACRC4L_00030 [Mycoplasma sp.]
MLKKSEINSLNVINNFKDENKFYLSIAYILKLLTYTINQSDDIKFENRHATIIVKNKRIICSGYDVYNPHKINDKVLIGSFMNAINNSSYLGCDIKGATIFTTNENISSNDVSYAVQSGVKKIICYSNEINYLNSFDLNNNNNNNNNNNSSSKINVLLESGIVFNIIPFGDDDFIEILKSKGIFQSILKTNDKSKKIDESIFLKNIDSFINVIFMLISYLTSVNSFDDSYQVGSVFVKKKIIEETNFRKGYELYILSACGYNGFNDKLTQYNNKEEKSELIVHAEENCILSCIKNNIKMDDMIAYSTLYSCDNCQSKMFDCGIQKIFYNDSYYRTKRDDENKIYFDPEEDGENELKKYNNLIFINKNKEKINKNKEENYRIQLSKTFDKTLSIINAIYIINYIEKIDVKIAQFLLSQKTLEIYIDFFDINFSGSNILTHSNKSYDKAFLLIIRVFIFKYLSNKNEYDKSKYKKLNKSIDYFLIKNSITIPENFFKDFLNKINGKKEISEIKSIYISLIKSEIQELKEKIKNIKDDDKIKNVKNEIYKYKSIINIISEL